MHDVRPIAHDVRRVELDERRVGAAGVDVRRIAREPRLLDAGAQRQPVIERHAHFRLPRDRPGRSVVEIEVVLILPRLDEKLEVAVVPSRAAAPRPGAQGLVLQEVLVAFGREAQIRHGALAGPQAARQHAHGALVDLDGAELEAGVAPPRLIDDAGRRRVPKIGVLRAHNRGDDFADAGAAQAGDAFDRRVAPLDPGAPDQPHARQREVDLWRRARNARRRRDHGETEGLNLTEVGIADLQRVGAEGNAVQAPPRCPAVGIG